MSIAKPAKKSPEESPIFDEVSLYKVVRTNKGQAVMLHYDGSVSAVMEFKGINNTSFSEADFERVLKRIEATASEIQNPAMTVQFSMISTNEVSTDEEDIKGLSSFLKPRAEYVQKLAKDNKVFTSKFYLSVFYKTNVGAENKDGILKTIYKKYIKQSEEKTKELNRDLGGVERRVLEVTELIDNFRQAFFDIGTSCRQFETKKEYYDFLQGFFRPNKSREHLIDIDDSVESPRRTLFSGVRAKVKKSDFVLDDYYHKVYMLDRSPKELIYGPSIEVIQSVPFEFLYTVTFRVLTHEESMRTFKGKLAERRMIVGADDGSIVEDRTLVAEEQRVSKSYDEFAFGAGVGAKSSVNFVLRLKMSHLEKMQQQFEVSRNETIRRIDQQLSKRIFSSFGQSEWICEENTNWSVFTTIIPGLASMHKGTLKDLFLTTENIPYFIGLYDNRRHVEHNGVNHYFDNRGNLVTFDLMDPSLPAWNYLVSGQTGSGKSVLMNSILTMQFAETEKTGQSPVICILDVGGDRGSYSKFMKLVGGTEINLSGAIKPSIQMFELKPERSLPVDRKVDKVVEVLMDYNDKIRDIKGRPVDKDEMETRVRGYYLNKLNMNADDVFKEIEMIKTFQKSFGLKTFEEAENIYKRVYTDLVLEVGECKPDNQKLTQIMGVLEVILSTSAKKLDGFSVYDYDEVLELVAETYNRVEGRQPFLTDFYETCVDMVDDDEPTNRRMLTKVKNYTRKESYGMFDRETSIDTDSDVILADLKGIESEPQLQIIYTLLLSQLFNDKMYFTRDRRKLIVRDEAWSLMKNERAREYFVEDLRTARKNGFATISISQLPTDYLQPDPAIGRAIISNSQVNIFCKFSTESICQEVGREYNLNQEIVGQMMGLGVQKKQLSDGSIQSTFAKFMMLIPDMNNNLQVYVLNNLLHPFEYALYSSSAEDNAIIEYYMTKTKQYENLEDVLWLITREGHIGDEGLATYLEKSGYMNQARRVRRNKK